MNIIDNVNQEQIKEIPEFSAGDDVVVQVRVKEGERERLQAFHTQHHPRGKLWDIFLYLVL